MKSNEYHLFSMLTIFRRLWASGELYIIDRSYNTCRFMHEGLSRADIPNSGRRRIIELVEQSYQAIATRHTWYIVKQIPGDRMKPRYNCIFVFTSIQFHQTYQATHSCRYNNEDDTAVPRTRQYLNPCTSTYTRNTFEI